MRTHIYKKTTNDSSIAFFYHLLSYIARPFEKVTARLMINVFSRPLRASTQVSLKLSAKITRGGLPRTDKEPFAFVRALFINSELFCRLTVYYTL